MSVSYAAQRNSHFVTRPDPHQNARRCGLPLALRGVSWPSFRAAKEEELPCTPLDRGTAISARQPRPPTSPPRSKSSVWNYIFIKWLPRSSEPFWAEPTAQPAAPCPQSHCRVRATAPNDTASGPPCCNSFFLFFVSFLFFFPPKRQEET